MMMMVVSLHYTVLGQTDDPMHASAGVRYLTVCGLTVRGRREVGADGAVVYDKQRPRVPAEYAYDSYEQVSRGRGCHCGGYRDRRAAALGVPHLL